MTRRSVADKLTKAMTLVNDRQHTSPGLKGDVSVKAKAGRVPKAAPDPEPVVSTETTVVLAEPEVTEQAGVDSSVQPDFTEVEGIAIPVVKRRVHKSSSLSFETHESMKRSLGVKRGVGKFIGKLLNESIIGSYDRKVSSRIQKNREEAFVEFFKDDPGLSHVVRQALEDRENKVFFETVQMTIEVDPGVFNSFRMFCQDFRCPQHYVISYLYKKAIEKGN